MQENVESKI